MNKTILDIIAVDFSEIIWQV